MILVPVFLMKQLIVKNICIESTAFSTPPVIRELGLLYSKRYLLSGMLIHQQNLYAPHSKRRTGRHEAQSRGPDPHTKNPCCMYTGNMKFQTDSLMEKH
jgi:hypothetical protein